MHLRGRWKVSDAKTKRFTFDVDMLAHIATSAAIGDTPSADDVIIICNELAWAMGVVEACDNNGLVDLALSAPVVDLAEDAEEP
jgi:hypothetical protein